ncbi:hypothetical protein FACS189440_18510 [Bacteroidia bacterium]|nr:hypothetical protein FACS189440_18510 [Bacteroidia bacterium]
MKKNLVLMLLFLAGAVSMNGQISDESIMVVTGSMVNTGTLISKGPIDLRTNPAKDSQINNTATGDIQTPALTVDEFTLLNNEGDICVGCVTVTPPVPGQTIEVTAPGYGSFLWTSTDLQMVHTFTPESPAHPGVDWSDDYAGNNITAAGVLNIPALSEPAGEAVVRVTATAQDDSEVTGTKDITVRQAVTGITISTTSPATVPNSTETATIILDQVLPSNAYDKSVIWSCTGCTVQAQTSSAVINLAVGSNSVTANWSQNDVVKSNTISIKRAAIQGFTCEGLPDDLPAAATHVYLYENGINQAVYVGDNEWLSDLSTMGNNAGASYWVNGIWDYKNWNVSPANVYPNLIYKKEQCR